MIRLILATAISVNLAACSTPMKLDNVPVEDRTQSSRAVPTGASSSSQAGGQSTVAAVNTTQVNSDAAALAAGRIVYFDYDSFVIRPEFQGVIEDGAKRIQVDKGIDSLLKVTPMSVAAGSTTWPWAKSGLMRSVARLSSWVSRSLVWSRSALAKRSLRLLGPQKQPWKKIDVQKLVSDESTILKL